MSKRDASPSNREQSPVNITENLIDSNLKKTNKFNKYQDDDDDNINDNNSNKKRLNLKAFGKLMNLSLVPNKGLYNRNKLKIWTVTPNATAQHGVEYVEEMPEVSYIILLLVICMVNKFHYFYINIIKFTSLKAYYDNNIID